MGADPRSKWRWLLLPLAPLYLVYVVVALCVLGILGSAGALRRWWNAQRLVRRMNQSGKTMAWADVERAACGTIIVEWPYLGWPEARCWWTPERVEEKAAIAGIQIPVSELGAPEFDWQGSESFARWCRTHFVDGEACLVQCARSSGDSGRMLELVDGLLVRCPSIAKVQVWTGLPPSAAGVSGRREAGR